MADGGIIDTLNLEVKANSEAANTALTQLIETLKALKTESQNAATVKISTTLKDLSKESKDGANNTTKAKAALKELGNEASNSSPKIKGLVDSLKSTTGAFTDFYFKAKTVVGGVKAISGKIMELINQENAYVENLNLFNVAMGDSAEAALEFGEKVQNIMGLDLSDWIRKQGIFQALISGFGVAGDRATVMSQQLTQLSYDLASFHNMDVGEAFTKLQSGVSGELEPLRRLGYDLSQVRLQEEAASLGIEKNFNDMNQAEKVALRYHAIMTQFPEVQGDMARTLGTSSNQLRILKAELGQAGRAIGSIFIPALNAILPYATAVIRVIRDLANIIAKFFGFELPEIDYSGVQSAAGAVGDLDDNLGGAAGKAKKLKSYLLGFDELNVFEPPQDNGGSGAGNVAVGGGFDFDLPEYDFLQGLTENRIDGIVKTIKEGAMSVLEFLSPVAEAAVSIGNGILGVFQAIADGVVWIVGKIAPHWDDIKKTASDVWESLKDGAGKTFSGIGKVIVGIGDIFIDVGQIILGAAEGIGTFIGMCIEGGRTVWDWLSEKANAIADGANDLSKKVDDKLKEVGEGIVEKFTSAKDKVVSLWGSISEFFVEVGNSIYNAVVNVPGSIYNLFSEAKDGISNLWGSISEFFVEVGNSIYNAIQGVPGSIYNLFQEAKGNIESIWGGVSSWWSEVESSIYNAVSPIKESLESFFSDPLGSIKKTWESVTGWFDQHVVQPIEKLFNQMDLSFKLPHFEWGSEPMDPNGVMSQILTAIGLPAVKPTLKVSWYAGGGFPDEGELFVAREAGAEMVGSIGGHTAVANNDQIVEAVSSGVYQAVVAALNSSGNDSEPVQINLKLDSKTLYDEMLNISHRRGLNFGQGVF